MAQAFGIKHSSARGMLKGLGVPILELEEGEEFFNLPTFEITLLQILRPSGWGYRGHKRNEPLRKALRDCWEDSPIREELTWITNHYGRLEVQQMKDRLEQMGARMRDTKMRLKKRRKKYTFRTPDTCKSTESS